MLLSNFQSIILTVLLFSSIDLGLSRQLASDIELVDTQHSSFHRHILKYTSSVAVSSRGTCNEEYGRAWHQGNIFHQPLVLPSQQDCCNACNERSECIGWVYRRKYKHCYVKRFLKGEQRCSDCVRGTRSSNTPKTGTHSVAPTCNSQAGSDWSGSDLYRLPLSISDPGVCCEYCQQDMACKAWVWRSNSKTCWLKNSIQTAVACTDCIGGSLNEDAQLVVPKPVKFSDKCENDGERVSVRVSAGACAILKNRCAPANKDVPLTKDDKMQGPISESETVRANVAILEDAFDQALKKSCISIFEETCKQTAKDKAAMHDQDCASILTNGPGVSTRNCKDINDALRIFTDAVKPLCEFDSSIDNIET